jgi:hypothetical protein
MDFHGVLRRKLYFFYMDDISTSQETRLWASTACYEDSFTLVLSSGAVNISEDETSHFRTNYNLLLTDLIGPN